jgi:hypothetical protein
MTSSVVFKIPPTGMIFVSGVASSYDEEFYDPRLANSGIISKEDIHHVISNLNDGLESFWPCSPCYFFGYGCMICTIGLSLLCPRLCISQAEDEARRILHDTNAHAKYYDRHITFELKKTCCSSYIELSIPSNLLLESSGSADTETPPAGSRLNPDPSHV